MQEEEVLLRSLRSSSKSDTKPSEINDETPPKVNINNGYCCLCFQAMDVEGFNLQEQVSIRGQKPLKTIDVLCYVLGKQFMTDICVLTSSTTLCQKCGQDAASSYKFIKQCKINYEMRTTGAKFNTCLDIKIKVEDSCNDFDTGNDNYEADMIKVPSNTELAESAEDDDYESDAKSKTGKSKTKCKITQKRAKKISLSPILHETSTAEEFKCKFCLKEFSQAKNLRNHYVRVHAPKTFKCPDCPLSYGSKLYLHVHRKLNHKHVMCGQCGKTFTNIHTMKRHEKNHVINYTCGHCDKEYRTKQALKHHIKTLCTLSPLIKYAKPKEEFHCEHCDKKYSKRDSLQEHIRFKHKNGKCYTCTWCNKKLNNYSKLQEHIVVHTKDKKFTCKLCGGKFVNKSSLLYHTRIHTGDRPYKCDFCNETFINTSRRTKHVKSRHSEKLECDICLVMFTCQSSLAKHRQKHIIDPSLCQAETQSTTDDMKTVGQETEFIEITIKEEVEDFEENIQ